MRVIKSNEEAEQKAENSSRASTDYKRKEKESSAEGRNIKDKEEERAHVEMTQRLE